MMKIFSEAHNYNYFLFLHQALWLAGPQTGGISKVVARYYIRAKENRFTNKQTNKQNLLNFATLSSVKI